MKVEEPQIIIPLAEYERYKSVKDILESKRFCHLYIGTDYENQFGDVETLKYLLADNNDPAIKLLTEKINYWEKKENKLYSKTEGIEGILNSSMSVWRKIRKIKKAISE